MTGPIIPADQWPEDAHLHTWDSNGRGNWLRPSYGAWHLWASDIPLPPDHDWRVPVMRQQSPAIDPDRIMPPGHEHAAQDLRCQCCGYKTYHREHLGCIRAAAPAIDLGQLPRYSHAASYDEKCGIAGSYMVRDAAGEWVRYDLLLALIDGQANVRSSSAQCSEVATRYHCAEGIRGTAKRLRKYAKLNKTTLMGQTMEEAAAYIEAMQPTKGEEE